MLGFAQNLSRTSVRFWGTLVVSDYPYQMLFFSVSESLVLMIPSLYKVSVFLPLSLSQLINFSL